MSDSQSRLIASSAAATAASRWCPSISRKKTYSQGRRREGPALDLGHVEAALRERAQRAIENARLVARHDQHRRLVAPGRLDLLASEHQEARHVVREILDVAAEHLQIVQLGRHLRRDRGAARVVVRQARALGGGARLHQRRRAAGWPPASAAPAWRRSESNRRARSPPARCPVRASRHIVTSSAISALILRSLSMKLSSVWFTTPSVVFSTGTTPMSALPRSTSSNTPGSSRSASHAPTCRTGA